MRRDTTAPAGSDLTGLSDDEVAERVAAGRTNAVATATSRSLSAIVRANVFTTFNAILVGLFAVVALTGRWQNGLFGLVVVANSGVGIVQEVRAKRTLDRIAVLTAPTTTVLRSGADREVAAAEVVADDVLRLRAGDEVVADVVVLAADALEVDEALLTGESLPVSKAVGDDLRAGSIVVAGRGTGRVVAVGAATYANNLTAQARRFTLTHSDLVAGTDRLLRWIGVAMVLIGPLVLWSQFRTRDNHGWRDAVTATAGALVGMVPEGLVLLTSLAFVIAAVALARRKTLVQELAAVEGLARVDVVCLDKTGTLTEGRLSVQQIRVCDPAVENRIRPLLASFASVDPANATSSALARAAGEPEAGVRSVVAFSSARKWASIATGDGRTWLLGAPEVVLDGHRHAGVLAEAVAAAAAGTRVLALVETTEVPHSHSDPTRLTGTVVGLIVLTEQVKADAGQTLSYFTAQGVTLKVISGDSPATVGALAAAVGVPGVTGPRDAVDARHLPTEPDEFDAVVERCNAFGRVTPQQKQDMVAALQRRGHTVAMTGDGVNDALALKVADIGVAMGSGAPATRGVAQIVLLDSRFEHLPRVVAEGRRVTANIERAANLFLVKNVYSAVLALVAAATVTAYPLAPIQLTLISTVTIGVPGFFLALAPSNRRYRAGFLRRVLRFSVPVGLVVAMTAYGASRLARALEPAAGTAPGRAAATVAVLVAAMCTLAVLSKPVTRWKGAAIAAMSAVTVVLLAIHPVAESVFLLHLSIRSTVAGLAVGAAGATGVLAAAGAGRMFTHRRRPEAPADAARRHPTRSGGKR